MLTQQTHIKLVRPPIFICGAFKVRMHKRTLVLGVHNCLLRQIRMVKNLKDNVIW